MTRTLGIIKPSTRPGKAEELVAILPPGIEILHDQMNIHHGSESELRDALGILDAKVVAMAGQGAELIHPAGAPPMLLGFEGEATQIRRWEEISGKPVFTTGSSQVNALRALGSRRLLGFSYFRGDVNRKFARYFEEAGFDMLGMFGMDVDFQDVPKLPSSVVQAFIEPKVLEHPDADTIYLLGPAWKTLDLLDAWEAKFGIPVVHHIPAQSWEIQRRFGMHRPMPGYGRLVAELPALPAVPV
jgi:maleate cis-trans isomerase